MNSTLKEVLTHAITEAYVSRLAGQRLRTDSGDVATFKGLWEAFVGQFPALAYEEAPARLETILEADAPPPEFESIQEVRKGLASFAFRMCLVLSHGGDREVWLTPALRRLSEAFPSFTPEDRKGLLNILESCGAIAIVRRQGNPHPYSAIILNRHHPEFLEALQERERDREAFKAKYAPAVFS